MSKPRRPFLLFLTALPAILQFFYNVTAQDVVIRVKIGPGRAAHAEVSGQSVRNAKTENTRNFSFVRNRAAANDLAKRVTEVGLFGADGASVNIKKLIDGEYLAESDYVSWRYRVDLAPAEAAAAAAHASWVSGDTGVLMLDDLLPETVKAPTVRIELPAGWKNLAPVGESVPTSRELVVPIGRTWRDKSVDAGGFSLRLNVSGQWLFTDDEAAAMASEICGEYRKVFGSYPLTEGRIVIARFPDGTGPGMWQAETRGATVTIISGDMHFRTQSLQRLHEQLRHEMFHLWLPNGVNLSGNYDWFYEGSALYQSLKTAVKLNRIRFDDYLDTLSRAHDIDAAQPRRQSLLAASSGRWNGADTQVYARGMLVAFLCDVALLSKSRGKRSVEDLARDIYQAHKRPSAEQDGNTAVLGEMAKYPELAPIVDGYVKGSGTIDWAANLAVAGIEPIGAGRHSELKVRDKPGSRQKALLDKLGYNSWRKLSGSSK